MEKSKNLTNLSIIIGLLGVLALVGAWVAGAAGTVLGMNQQHLYWDAAVLLLAAIWLKLGAIYHKS
ncbi:hypothetical protein HYV98_01655 [Candidatus Azambacteria bacterium]|nr:hypothetical protein [Candidatus Azambacteria bacterium]